MKLFYSVRDRLVYLKLYMSRALSYITLINTGMVLFLFLSNLEKYGIDIRIQEWIIPLFLIGIFLLVLFGFLEDRLGFYSQEQRTTQSRNPYMTDIIERLDRIEEKIAELEKKRRIQ